MRKCPVCGQSAAPRAAFCPQCGTSLSTSTYARLLTGHKWLDFLLGMLLMFVLSVTGGALNAALQNKVNIGLGTYSALTLGPGVVVGALLWRRYPLISRGMLTALVIAIVLLLGALLFCLGVLKALSGK